MLGQAPFFRRGWASVLHRSPNMWTLISPAQVQPLFSAWSRRLRPTPFRKISGQWARSVYFEAAAVIISLTLLGQILELKARSQTSAAIKSLLAFALKTARRISVDGVEEDVPLSQVQVGDRLRVRPGERCPLMAWS